MFPKFNSRFDYMEICTDNKKKKNEKIISVVRTSTFSPRNADKLPDSCRGGSDVRIGESLAVEAASVDITSEEKNQSLKIAFHATHEENVIGQRRDVRLLYGRTVNGTTFNSIVRIDASERK